MFNYPPRCEPIDPAAEQAPRGRAAREGLNRLGASGPREPNVPTETPEEVPPDSPPELPAEPPVELPSRTPQEMPPGAPPDLPPGSPPEAERPGDAGRAGASALLTILLVEDDALIRQNTADMLSELGHEVLEAGRAAQALAVLAERSLDLLLCDVSLPDESGVELARRARLRYPGLPVVFATGHSEIEGLVEAGLSGSSLLLSKPFEQEALAACLARATDRTEEAV
ncbi:MAG: response regulator [Tistlia sp.]|uniref:response regulator n=1 Tax=Tistlia sp. TaxID=3057121 RepID=UPI0034A1D5D3